VIVEHAIDVIEHEGERPTRPFGAETAQRAMWFQEPRA